MDGVRSSFSRLKKDIKHRMRGRKGKPDRTGADTTGGGVSSDPDAVVGGRDGEGSGTNTAGGQVHSRDQSQLEPIPAGENDDGRQKREAEVDEKGTGRRDLRLDSNVKVAVGSGPSREVERVYPPPSGAIPPIPNSEEPNSAWTQLFWLLHLIALQKTLTSAPTRALSRLLL